MALKQIIQRCFDYPFKGGRIRSEWVAALFRNRWPRSIGIGGRNASEYAIGFGKLGQKIEIKQKIRPFTENESRRYIDHRLRLVGSSSEIMTPKAISLICSYAQGISSLINHVCDTALWVGCRMGCKNINVDVIEKVIQNLEGSKILPKILLSIQLIKRIRKYPAQISVSFEKVSGALFHKFHLLFSKDYQRTVYG